MKPICVFEGFVDFLSYASLNKDFEVTCIILNSLANIPKLENHLKENDQVELYLDNDLAGDKASDYLCQTYDAKDMRSLYPNYKDLNDYLMDNFLFTAKK